MKLLGKASLLSCFFVFAMSSVFGQGFLYENKILVKFEVCGKKYDPSLTDLYFSDSVSRVIERSHFEYQNDSCYFYSVHKKPFNRIIEMAISPKKLGYGMTGTQSISVEQLMSADSIVINGEKEYYELNTLIPLRKKKPEYQFFAYIYSKGRIIFSGSTTIYRGGLKKTILRKVFDKNCR